ncbi:hypothetical protein BCR15_04565 [Tessaracoccus lapidicaptus]|uniref:DUF1707 domain-containing protein n=1 Tax=Tessaracoccus lapidicaptus TaxID=1427523 RepID=A0A1C0AM01_9ACTN|nr:MULTISPECIES: DUF1707 domain-containing protein [Tessaracoccus]AQX15539.1 hypothetical protein BKM78_06085 [Tessaracoccus sp. T2.5-30]OCL33908.1 hypothetical protein BCR15_04565 [Tessaracoccus lapidicaptus]
MPDELVPRPRMRAGDADRDDALRVLQQAHAAGRLSVEELGSRQDAVLAAQYVDDLLPVVADLPEGALLQAGPAVATPSPATTDVGMSVTFMTGRDVDLAPGTSLYRNFAWWGGDDIILDRALGPGVLLTLELSAVMAGHDIYVPEGVRVIDESFAIMAGNDIDRDARGDGSNGTLILKGFLFWAGHDVKLSRRQRG